MKINVHNIWQKLLGIGIPEGARPSFIKKMRLLNAIASTMVIIGCVSLLSSFLWPDNEVKYMRILFISGIGLIVMFLNHYKLQKFGPFLLIYGSVFGMFLMPIFTGDIVLGNFFWFHHALSACIIFPILLFDRREEPINFWMAFLYIGFLAVFIDKIMLYGQQEPLDLSFIQQNYFFYKIPQLMIMLLIILLFMTEVNISSWYARLLNTNHEELLNRQKLIQAQNEELKRAHQEIYLEKDELNALNQKLKANEEVLKKAYDKIKLSQNEIEEQHRLILEQNEDLMTQQKEITQLNINLEKIVADRTWQLEIQNKALTDYAYFNSHKVRGPVARIMGLLDLMRMTKKPIDEDLLVIVEKLEISIVEMDEVVKRINTIFDEKYKSLPK